MRFSYLIFVAVPMAAAVVYRCRREWLFGFCRAMCTLSSARLLFVRIMVLAELVFHFLFMSSGRAGIGMVISTALLLLFVVKQRKCDLMTMFRANTRYLFAVFIVCLISGFIPSLFPVTMSLTIFICTACFWPSPAALFLWHFPISDDHFQANKAQCVECYFHMTARRSQHVSDILNTF